MVTRFCASKTPARRKETDTAASKRDCRGLVVCGTSVTSARSVSSAGMLTTSAGRTFAAMPRSTNQTSPRARRCHSGCSRRSSSVNSRSATATKSSSCGKSCGAKATRRASSAISSERSRSGSASNSSSSFCVACVTKSDSHFVFFASRLSLISRHNYYSPTGRHVVARRSRRESSSQPADSTGFYQGSSFAACVDAREGRSSNRRPISRLAWLRAGAGVLSARALATRHREVVRTLRHRAGAKIRGPRLAPEPCA